MRPIQPALRHRGHRPPATRGHVQAARDLDLPSPRSSALKATSRRIETAGERGPDPSRWRARSRWAGRLRHRPPAWQLHPVMEELLTRATKVDPPACSSARQQIALVHDIAGISPIVITPGPWQAGRPFDLNKQAILRRQRQQRGRTGRLSQPLQAADAKAVTDPTDKLRLELYRRPS